MIEYFINGVIGKYISLINIPPYHFYGAVAGLFHDQSFFYSLQGCIGSKSMTKAVSPIKLRIQSNGCRIFFDYQVDTLITEPAGRYFAVF